MNRADRTILLSLLCAFAAIAWGSYEPYTFLHGDGAFYANINKSIARDASLDQGEYHPHSWLEDNLGWNENIDQGWTNVSLGRDGRWYPKHSYVLPLFATPLYMVFGLPGLLIFHVLMFGLLMLASFRVASTWLSVGGAATATLLTAAQPIILQDIYSYNNDVFYAAMLMCGAWAFVRNRPIVAGLLMGVGVWAKATNIVFVVPFGIWLIWRKNPRAIARATAAFALPIILFLLSNWYLFGSPFTTSYDQILVRQNGILTTESITARFDEPLGSGLKRVMTHSGEGLLPKAPLLVLVVPGLLVLARRKKGAAIAAICAAVFVCFLVIQAKYQYTYARFFLPIVGLGVLPLGAFFEFASKDWSEVVRPGYIKALLGTALLIVCISMFKGDHYQLSDHVEDAQVKIGNQRCDYFNNLHQKFECNGERSKLHFWGLSLGDECTLNGEPQSMLWLHPSVRGRKKTILFPDVPAGKTLKLRYGMAQSSRGSGVRFKLSINGKSQDIPPPEAPGEMVQHALKDVLTEPANSLELEVQSPPNHWRHFCFDASVVDDD